MKLSRSVTITPPKYSDQKGNIISPDSFNLDSLQINYMDSPSGKSVIAYIYPFPTPLILWKDVEYDKIGDWTQKQAENKVSELLGENVAESLGKLYPATLESNPNGPGTILSKMLSRIGIKSTPNCECKKRAIMMNRDGVEWCEKNVDVIVGWLKEESEKRKIPFVEFLARTLVLKAIAKSKKLNKLNVVN